MGSGLWTAASGAIAKTQIVDTTANNLANVDTQGFKKDAPTFKEYLSVAERDRYPQDIPRGPIKDKEFYPIDGKDQSFVVTDGTYTHFSQGHLRVTHSPLDIALDGPGFIEVNTPAGIRYTRNGALKMAADGRLVTSEGHPVLSAQPQGLTAEPNAQNPQAALAQRNPAVQPQDNTAQRIINLKDVQGAVSITESGEVFVGGDQIAKLNVVEFANPKKLRKQGGTLFENKESQNILQTTNPKTIVRQGVIETSNVNPVEEMTNLIRANRSFEMDLKSMKTHADLMGKEVNDVGKL